MICWLFGHKWDKNTGAGYKDRFTGEIYIGWYCLSCHKWKYLKDMKGGEE